MAKQKKAATNSSATRRSPQPYYDADVVRSFARGRWADILSTVGGIPSSVLDGEHHPCPKCGGTDRFRFTDDGGDGSIICNQCCRHEAGNGFRALEWLTGRKFYEVVTITAEYLGVPPSNGDASYQANSHDADPAEHLELWPWDESAELLAATWCLCKPPITVAAIRAAGGCVARYRGQYTVIALPVWGEQLDRDGAKPVGWCLYNITGGTLPKWAKRVAGEPPKPPEQVKVKLTHGSRPGIIADLQRLLSAAEIWKVEGPSDLLAALSIADLPPDVAIITNANGAKENPPAWLPPLFSGRRARVLHDADKPGQDGAMGWKDERSGQQRPGWAGAIASTAAECRNVVLPYPLAETHGKDLRDWLNEQPRAWAEIQALAVIAEIIRPPESGPAQPKPIEADDDPHRLARMNLERYAAQADGATIRYWRSEWYTWKPSRACYKQISEDELRAKLSESIKQEFDRLNIIDQQSSDSEKPPKARKVTKALVTNVLAATASITCIPSSVELMTWLDCSGVRDRRNYVAMLNGVLDLDKLMAGADDAECILPHSPKWFSTVRLPYAFDVNATCPRWLAFLQKNLEADHQRIAQLQEWAGYCLLPDTGHQKFLALEGEGANGKSVYCAALSAMLGIDNCSHVTLERFGERFEKTATLGKLVNICADVGEIDRVAEGCLKSFTSGDTMYFDRKHVAGVSCIPTARLVLCFNNRPRLSDRSGGIWRRMLLVPWFYQISDAERVPNMDKPWFWERSGELPGIFLWAIKGLHRLRQQGRFTESVAGNAALEDYRNDSNPARDFLKDHFTRSDSSIRCSIVYHFYSKWCQQTGHKPLSDRQFGREVRRLFSDVRRERVRFGKELQWRYKGIAFNSEEMFGEKTSGDTLF